MPDLGRFFCQARRFDAGILTDFKSNQRSPGGKRCPKTAFCHVSNKAYSLGVVCQLIMARQEGFEPPAPSLGVAVIRCSSVAVKRGEPLILLNFTVVTLLVMYGFVLLIFIVFCGCN